MKVLQIKKVCAAGTMMVLTSLDSSTWTMRCPCMSAIKPRVADIPQLTPVQRGYIDLIELPANGFDVRHAVRNCGGAL